MPSHKDSGGSPEAALRESEARFRAFVNASTDMVYRMSPDWSEIRELDGRGFVENVDASRRSWIADYIFPDDQPHVRAAIDAAIRNKRKFEVEHRVWRVDGSVGWTLSRAVPLFDERGEIAEWFGAASDVTERREMQDALARMTSELDRQKRSYEGLISATPDLIYAFDKDYHFTFANRALLTMWGRTLEESIGKRLIEVGYEPWHAEMHEREIDQVIATKKGIRGEVGFPHATLGWRTYDYIFMPMLNDAGEVESIAGTTRDITDIKRAEEHLRLLVNELNHRVKNTLATIHSIASQTFRGDAASPQARVAFEGRLIALSDVHTVLTRTNWEGANLREIVAQALSPFDDGTTDNRLTIAGPDKSLRPQVSLAIAMALHELASNAVKYGAWSNATGRVEVRWTIDAGQLHLEWAEKDGPSVAAPLHRGFGTRLLQRGLARELDGEVNLDYRETGLVCTIDMMVEEPA
ncbi:HWE histidine kinase domain-containing protein [Novosphingobium sp. BL-8H]|uniref:sensor histidine kinase n=1 Tax=Novosphingobium sp. BL-8H TaxID=3127640 RepID=UPI0037580A22